MAALHREASLPEKRIQYTLVRIPLAEFTVFLEEIFLPLGFFHTREQYNPIVFMEIFIKAVV